jgi:hypothetical protein
MFTALNTLVIASAKFAFDFVGLTKEMGQQAMRTAEKMAQAMAAAQKQGAGGGGGGGGGGGYPATFKSQFVKGCASSGKLSSSQCRCIINKAEKAYSLPEFVSAVRRSQGGSVPPKLRSIFINCASS